MSVHPDMTALRAVDACGGIYTPDEEASGFAAGHRVALASAMVSVGAVDGLMAAMLDALQGMVSAFGDITITVDGVVQPETDPEIVAARAVIAKATGSEASA